MLPTANSPYLRQWSPTIKQAAFLLAPQREVLFGGAAGPGKSFALVLSALLYFHTPNYSAVLFRRTYPQLAGEGGLIPKAHEILAGTGAKWNEQKKTYTSKEGAVLKFAHLQHEQNKRDHDGMEYQFVGFDELTHFGYPEVAFLMGRMRRRSDHTVPLRFRATTNPGGPGHAWVKARYVDNEEGSPDRLYIPATLVDNPYLDHEDYRKQLDNLPPVERAQKKNGDWEVVPDGVLFKDEHFRRYTGNPLDVARSCDRVIISVDPKNTFDTRTVARQGESFCSIQAWGLRGPDALLLAEDTGLYSADDTVKRIKAMIARFAAVGVEVRGVYVESAAAGPYVIKRCRTEIPGVQGVKPQGQKDQRGNAVLPFMTAGNVLIPTRTSAPWVAEWIHEVKQFPAHPNDRGDSMTQALEVLLGRPVAHVHAPAITQPLYRPPVAW